MGRFGLWVNLAAVLWQIFQVFFLSFPLSYPVTTNSMNWACLVVAIGVLVFAVNGVVYSRRRYHSPKPLLMGTH
ncbi:hypothetical protein EDD36DRAFT_439645 [Exophiala viscosa]|uniref:Uncharacterized protein n=1 Tax=Exophiala viscosa TaxID=2486360 RepID=A0AAN6ICC7_9EURO|nr:hypothetical protein EDD36DRAFT_439645 [Exophiala viscosa]